MTIGANLNGGSLTIGNINSVTNINSYITNLATGGLTGSGRVNIGNGTNLDGSQLYLGSSTLYQSYIRAKLLSINDIGNTTTYIGTGGLSGSDRVFIASGANAVGSEMYLGSASLYQSFIRGTIINIADNGGSVNLANNGLPAYGSVNICAGANGTGSIAQLGSLTIDTIYIRGKYLQINDGNNTNYINNGITNIGNLYGSGYVAIYGKFSLYSVAVEPPAIEIVKPNPQISIRHNNNPSRYDAFVIGFGSGGGSPASEAGASSGSNRFPNVTGNDTTGYCARIKCVSNVDHPFDYGSIGTFYFQGKNDNNWGGGVTSRGNYNTVCVMNPYLNRIGVNRTDSGSYTLDVNGLIRTASGFVNDSDRRIKANIIDVEDDEALQLLRRLKPKTYTYKDTNTKGTEPVYGFIAQEVREVISYSTSLSKDYIPNIYDKVTLVEDILTFSTFNTSDLAYDVSGELFSSIKLLPYKESQGIILTITEIIDSHSVKIDLSTLPKNNAGDIITFDTELFVYGQEVNDFHSMKKDAIWTVATAALQEVDRQLQAEKEKTVQLGTTVNTLKDIVESLVLRITAIEQRTN